ncbi:GTPase Era [Mycoplasma sp. 1018B]|uniref:GTPase Era n=1 Tax=Mycoplasma sp. 1018B TaxID=2967302 RepID=UPI00211CBC24|nr:GTPase Era [Mycoplasma sp. 1018B]UUM19225.1 GTPase Era [Mycoplasma sp. 1018B]
MKIGLFTIIGRPNVGKSSLLNSILNYDLSIVSNTVQTTRDTITGIYNENETQLVFLDTPGIHKPLNLLGEQLNKAAFSSMEDIDCVLFLSPINEPIGKGDLIILEKILKFENKIAVITKLDLAKHPNEIEKKLKELEKFNFKYITSLSQRNLSSIKSLIDLLKTFTYEGQPYYEDDYITDKSMRFIAKEVIRESAINFLHDELPHSIATEVLEFNEHDELIEINALIYVKKDSQKGMLIGKNGTMIKQIGILSRKKMQNLFNKKVTLNLKVKVAKNWVDNNKILKKLDYM